MEFRNYVVIMPDGTESFHDVNCAFSTRTALHDVVNKAISKSKLTCSRSDPKTIKVKVYRLNLREGQVTRASVGEMETTLPFAPMTDAEYEQEMQDVVAGLPLEFKIFVEAQAYIRGHSAGYEEVVAVARSIADSLKPAVDQYITRMKKEGW